MKILHKKRSILRTTNFLILHVLNFFLFGKFIIPCNSVNCISQSSGNLFLLASVQGEIYLTHHVSDCCPFGIGVRGLGLEVGLNSWKFGIVGSLP